MSTVDTMPGSRSRQLVIQKIDDETLVYDLDRHKAHCLNRAASLVWSHCDGATTISEMARILQSELKIPADEEVVWLALAQLRKAKLLDGPVRQPFGVAIPARREVIRRMGLIGATLVLLPAITSIIAPTAVSAATCLAKGGACKTAADCCSGVCLSKSGKCL